MQHVLFFHKKKTSMPSLEFPFFRSMGWEFFCVRLTLGEGGRDREGKRIGSEERTPISPLSYTPYSPSTTDFLSWPLKLTFFLLNTQES
jgi:hypothetical protein